VWAQEIEQRHVHFHEHGGSRHAHSHTHLVLATGQSAFYHEHSTLT
jgi:hypothetical protein